MPSFESSVPLPVSAATAFAWHEQPGALARLTPPWESIEELEHTGGIRAGARVTVRARVGPLATIWRMEHRDYEPGRQFVDIMRQGPFARWEHRHGFEPVSAGACVLRDTIHYEIPGGRAGSLVAGRFVRRQLQRLFAYRHRVTAADLATWRGPDVKPGRVLVAGASGLIASALIPLLRTRGWDVVRLVRRTPVGAGECWWDPAARRLDAAAAGEVAAIVNLAGENVGAGRWRRARREAIRRSRLDATATLREFARTARVRPEAWVNASATGYFGSRGDEVLHEESGRGAGFLADVCEQWEAAALAVRGDVGRLAILRFGVVLSPRGGMLAKLLPVFRCGLGGRLGDGRAWLSWIAIDDVVAIVARALEDPRWSGTCNTVAPRPVTSAEFAAELGRVLSRPALFAVPALALRAAFGEMADETILTSTRVSGERLAALGHRFRFPALPAALPHLLGAALVGDSAVSES